MRCGVFQWNSVYFGVYTDRPAVTTCMLNFTMLAGLTNNAASMRRQTCAFLPNNMLTCLKLVCTSLSGSISFEFIQNF